VRGARVERGRIDDRTPRRVGQPVFRHRLPGPRGGADPAGRRRRGAHVQQVGVMPAGGRGDADRVGAEQRDAPVRRWRDALPAAVAGDDAHHAVRHRTHRVVAGAADVRGGAHRHQPDAVPRRAPHRGAHRRAGQPQARRAAPVEQQRGAAVRDGARLGGRVDPALVERRQVQPGQVGQPVRGVPGRVAVAQRRGGGPGATGGQATRREDPCRPGDQVRVPDPHRAVERRRGHVVSLSGRANAISSRATAAANASRSARSAYSPSACAWLAPSSPGPSTTV
jgi:hypothetical protein